MRFSTRSKVGGLLSLLAIVTIITAFMLSGLVFRGTATHASNAQYSATQGTLTPAGAVSLRNTTTNQSPSASASISHRPRSLFSYVEAGLRGDTTHTSTAPHH